MVYKALWRAGYVYTIVECCYYPGVGLGRAPPGLT